MSMTNTQDASMNVDALIGERVHQLMWRNQVTQTALAPKLGITQAGLSPKLRGKRSWSADDLVTIAREFNVSVGYLFGEEPTGPKPLQTDYEVPYSGIVIDLTTREIVA